MPAIVDLLKQYLLQKRSVTLKNLGQFSLEKVSASVHPVIHEFRPPFAVILFEEQKNCDTEDGFVVFVSENSKTSKDEAKEIVNDFVGEIEYALKTENTYTVTPLGIFKRNPDHCLSFEFDVELNILPQTYGMPVFVLGDAGKKKTEAPLKIVETITEPQQQISEPHIEEISVTKSEEEYTEEAIDEPPIQEENKPVHEEIPIAVDSESTNEEEQPLLPEEKSEPEIKPQQQEPLSVQEIEKEKGEIAQEEPMPVKKKKKKFVFPLIILLVLCAAGAGLYFTGYWETIYNKIMPSSSVVSEQKQEVSKEQEVVKEDDSEIVAENEKKLSEEVVEEEIIPQKTVPAAASGAKYFIVADCFQYPELAEKRVQALQSEGHPAVLAGQTQKGLHIVAYSGFATREQAEEELKKIKAATNPHAWMYVK